MKKRERKKIVVDETYEFLPKNIFFRIFSAVLRVIAVGFMMVYNTVVFGMKVEGRENLKGLPSKGFVSVCNHVHGLDCTMVACALHVTSLYYPSRKGNLDLPWRKRLIHTLGAVPIPPSSVKAFQNFQEAMAKVLKQGKVVHIFPEGCLKPYCPELREFKRGAFKMAYDNQVPVVPLVISYRPSRGWRRITNKKPLLNISILKPQIADFQNSEKEEVKRMLGQVKQQMNEKLERELNKAPSLLCGLEKDA